MTHQTDEKHLNKMSEYFVGVVNIAFNHYNNHFVLPINNRYLLKNLTAKSVAAGTKKLLLGRLFVR